MDHDKTWSETLILEEKNENSRQFIHCFVQERTVDSCWYTLKNDTFCWAYTDTYGVSTCFYYISHSPTTNVITHVSVIIVLIFFALFPFPRSFQPVWFRDTLPFLGVSNSSKGDARVVRRGGGWADSQCDTGQSQPCDLVATVAGESFGSVVVWIDDWWFNSIYCCLWRMGCCSCLTFVFEQKSESMEWFRMFMLFHSLRKRAEDGLERVSPQHFSTPGPSLGHVRWPCGRPVDWKLGSSEMFLMNRWGIWTICIITKVWCFKKCIWNMCPIFLHFGGVFLGGYETYFWKIKTDQWKEGGNKRKGKERGRRGPKEARDQARREAAETQATSKAISPPARQQGKSVTSEKWSPLQTQHVPALGVPFWRGIFEVTSHLLPTRSLKASTWNNC